MIWLEIFGILRDLKNCGVKGHSLIFIQNYLSNRKFKVRLSNTLYEEFEREAGVPQAGILKIINKFVVERQPKFFVR